MSVPTLVIVAWALLLVAWVIGNAPFAAPDETDHYVRALGVSQGHLSGTADPSARIGATPAQIAWTAQATRDVSLPAVLDPRPYGCELFGAQSAACQTNAGAHASAVTAVTAVGNYQPFPYLVAAVLLRDGNSAPAALRLGRAAQALVVLALLAIAVLALFDARSPLVSLLGPLLAVTPMALFCGASLGGSGIEIAAAVAFLACLLRLCRQGVTAAPWWACTAMSGALLALSRSASPLWLVLLLLLALAWGRQREVVRRFAGSRDARLVAIALGLAVALNRLWETTYGSRVTVDASQLRAGLSAGIREWWRALPELVGKFGYVDVKLPLAAPLLWLACLVFLSLLAFAASERRGRIVLLLTVACASIGPAAFYALVLRPTGFGLQGRHVLPALVAVPLVAGETLNRHRDRISAGSLRLLARTVALAVAVTHVVAWYVNARRYAVGESGPAWFLSGAAWAPPGGWWPWLTITLLASVCLGSLAFLGTNGTAAVEP